MDDNNGWRILFCYDFYKEDTIHVPGLGLVSIGLVLLVVHLI